MTREIEIVRDLNELSTNAAVLMGVIARQSIAERGRFVAALSGGNTVRGAYELFATQEGIDWTKVFLFWGDDRFVDPDNPYSNYKLAKEALIDRLPSLPKENVFPIPSSTRTPEEGAEIYSQTIKKFFELREGEWPRFDLCQNGLGPDGHTGSIFPHSPAVTVTDRIAVMNHAGLKPWVDRITFTLPVFNAARHVLFLAVGEDKAEVLKEVLDGKASPDDLPASAVLPMDGRLIWMVDEAIASKIRAESAPPR